MNEQEEPIRNPEPQFNLVEFARSLIEQSNMDRIAQLKAEADARNAQFKKGTING